MSQNPQGRGVLVTGGGGYIGSHAVWHLKAAGYRVVVVDNFSRGHEDVMQTLAVPYVKGDVSDKAVIRQAVQLVRPDVVMHFAAYAFVGESVAEPALYYQNNVAGTLSMLEALRELDIKRVIFSSTCATYGTPARVPITEDTPQQPINPYGSGKLMVEQMLKDFETAYGFRSVLFRYFNAAGALPSGLIGERHEPEPHLIPLAIRAALGGPELTVFGDDYPTPDGTCVRDYIHVSDLASAHILGMEHLLHTETSGAFNIGTGLGNSVAEVIKAVEQVSGRKVPFSLGQRRAGDPPVLVAAADKIKATLGWQPRYTDLREIVETAWKWHSKGIN